MGIGPNEHFEPQGLLPKNPTCITKRGLLNHKKVGGTKQKLGFGVKRPQLDP